VTIDAGREGNLWRFDVSDNGIGIEAEHHERIFEPFKRLHAAEAYQGTGLGLSICKKIVEEFGGRIWVRSAPGAGATFSFTIKDGPSQ
jgi:signal transduction histidine kinase